VRGNVPAYELAIPRSLDHALELVEAGHVPFAGGTDLMVVLEAGKLPVGRYVSVLGLPELAGVESDEASVTLGAGTTYREVRGHPLLEAEFPMLVRAAIESGAIAIQNRGTLGGNIMNASPAADSPPALLAYGAEVELVSRGGRRWVPYAGFHTGYKLTVRRPDELLARIRLPRRRPGDWRQLYEKVGTRSWQAISKVCFAGIARVEDGVVREAQIGLGAVAPMVVLAQATMQALLGRRPDAALEAAARAAMAHDARPIDDIRSTAHYRAAVAGNVAAAFVRSLA
jgi:CO/xanthine dehydrogenase FAD-binding subunit